ncbi:MAG: hypothetical protein SFV53_06655 [Rickettsiales bacterium]|nr:hypothetical protein [Rickettsiales bacterium]
MSRSERRKLTQEKLDDQIKSLFFIGYTRDQIIQSIDKYSSKETSEEDLKMESLRLDDDKKKSDENEDDYIDREDLFLDQDLFQELSEEQIKSDLQHVESSDSESSTETIIGETESGGRVKARFSLGSKTVTFGDRGRTVAGPQVEHALAYVVYESIAKEAIAGQKISKAAEKITEAFSSFSISDKAMSEMNLRLNELSKKAMEFRTTKRFLKVQKETNPNFLSEKYDIIHESLIRSARAKYAEMISSAMDICLLGANKMPNVSYPTEGVAPNPNTGKEKEAKNNLLLLTNFLKRALEASRSAGKRSELLDDSKFLKKLEKKWGIKEQQINSIFSGLEEKDFDLSDKLVEIILPQVQEQITQHMGELFYYPSLKKTYPYTINKVKGDWAVSKEEWCDVMKINPETEERIKSKTPKYNKDTLPRSNDLEEMIKTVGQAQIGFAHMLPDLVLFGKKSYRDIMDRFLNNSVIENSRENGNMGWSEIIKTKSGESEGLVQWLSRNIQERVSKIDYENPLNSCSNDNLTSKNSSPVFLR